MLTDTEIEQIALSEISKAQDLLNLRKPTREQNYDRYYGRKLGNEVKGRSQFITRELLDTIEWMMPYFIRSFASGDSKVTIKIKGQPPWVGKGIMEKIQEDLNDSTPNLFTVFYQWIKDCLLADTSFVKIDWDLEQVDQEAEWNVLSAEHMQVLQNDPAVKVTSARQGYMPDGSTVFAQVKATITKTVKDQISIANVPHWQFLAEPSCTDINDDYGKGQKTTVMLDYLKKINQAKSKPGKPFFNNLDKLGTHDVEMDGDYIGKDTAADSTVESDEDTGLKAKVDYVEWYTKMDVNEDGLLEDIVCFFGNKRLIRWENNDLGFVQFSAIKPIIDCFKLNGISYADLVVEIQNLQTMLFRRILDNFDFQNSGRWLRDPNSQIDINSLYNSVPGDVITGKLDGLKDLTPAPFNPGSLSILGYVEQIKENRTGITKYNQGSDSHSLNKTARGMGMVMNASMQRLELIGRIFVEIGFKDFYRKCVLAYQRYLRKPFTVTVDGEERQITPEMLQGDVHCQANMGVTASIGMEEAGKLERIIGMLMKFNEQYPGIFTPEQVHTLLRKYITSSGFKDVDDFLPDMKEYMNQVKQGQEQQGQAQDMMMKMKQREQQVDETVKMMNARTSQAKAEQEGQIAEETLDFEKEKSAQELHLDFLKELTNG